jgi:MFS family permease
MSTSVNALDAQPAVVDLSERREITAQTGLRSAALAALLVGYAMAVMDFFIVNVALPTMGRDLHASTSLLELVVSGYGVSFALLLVLGGRLGDAFGRHRLYMAGMAGFTVSSLACGLAPSAWALVGARILQGATAAMMVPQVLATIQARTEGEERTRAVGRYGATASLASAAGQVVGGSVVALDLAGTNWRGIFLVNVPVGIVGLYVARRNVPATRADVRTGADPVGTALLAAALLCLLLPLSEGAAMGWPIWSWALLGVTPLFAAAFASWERRFEAAGRTPHVPRAVATLPTMRSSLGLVVPFFGAFSGFMFVYALATQSGLGLGPLAAGLAVVPMAVAFGTASLAAPRLLGRVGPRVVLAGTVGQCALLAALSVAMLTTWPQVPLLLAEALLVLLGLAMGCVVSPTFRLALSGVAAHQAGAGSGVLVTTQQVAIALGATVLGTLYARTLGPVGDAGAVALVLAVLACFAAVAAVGARSLLAATR